MHGPLKVIQSIVGGVLIAPIEISSYIPSKVIFLKTKLALVDEDIIPAMFVHSKGIFNYSTVMVAGKTVHSFQYLGDAKLIREESGRYQLAPDQD